MAPPGPTTRDHDPSSIGLMEGAFFVPRRLLIDWINNHLQLGLTKVEDCASGAAYLQIFDFIHPGYINMSKVRWNAKQEYEFTQNYKLLQSAFDRIGIKKHIEVEKLMKGKAQDNLEFLQWIKAYYERIKDQIVKPYDPIERRKLGSSGGLPEWASLDIPKQDGSHFKRSDTPKPAASITVINNDGPVQSNSDIQHPSSDSLQKTVADLEKQLAASRLAVTELEASLEKERELRVIVQQEREFYYAKLRAIEIRCYEDNAPVMSAEELRKILYATEHAGPEHLVPSYAVN